MSEVKPDERLNLEGVACPLNFVKTKLKLEEMGPGKVLEVILDDGEPVKNVPRAVKEEGHRILGIERLKNKWKLSVRKSEVE